MPKPISEDKKIEWKNLIEQQRQSGLSIDKWCRQSQIEPHTFHYWKNKLYPKSLQKTSFTELNLKQANTILFQARGISVRMGSDCDPYFRKQLFSLFAEGLC